MIMIRKLQLRLLLSVMVVTCFMAGLSHASPISVKRDIQSMILQEAEDSIVPPALALAVAKVESGFDPDAVSSAGARGVMQIMPRTAEQVFGVSAGELWDPQLNIQLGLDYLSQLYRQYGNNWHLALSHYNGGTLKKYRGRLKPHSYTRKYVRDVMRWKSRYEQSAPILRASLNRYSQTYSRKFSKSKEGLEADREEIRLALAESMERYRELKERKFIRKENFLRKRNKKWGIHSQKYIVPTSFNHSNLDDFDEGFHIRKKQNSLRLDDYG